MKSEASQRIMVTGAGGRIGRRLIPYLGAHELFLTDLIAQPEQNIRALDILDPQAVEDAARGMDAILHCAIADYTEGSEAETASEEELRRYHDSVMRVNIHGTYHVYEAARRAGVSRVVYLSSLTTVLGCERSDHDPGMPPCPVNLYALSKLFGEQLGELYARTHGIRSSALRLGQPFPLGLPQEAEWLQDERSRKLLVRHDLIAGAVLSALSREEDPIFEIRHVIGGFEGGRQP